jgi:hypothetical protein
LPYAIHHGIKDRSLTVMISARRRSDTRRLILIGLFVSLIIHLFGGSAWDLLARVINKIAPPTRFASLQQTPPQADVIHIEKKAVVKPVPQVEKPTVAQHAAPPPPTLLDRPEPAPVTIHHEMEHIVHDATNRLPPQTGPGSSTAPHVTKPGAPRSTHPYYSDDQLAAMNAQFSQTIADAHPDLAAANAAMARPVQTMKHYDMHMNVGIHEGMNPGDGMISIVKGPWFKDGFDWYYIHYEYMYGDGHVEEANVPWPVHYPPNNDPLKRGDKRLALQGPPSDFVPSGTLTPILQSFFGGPDPTHAGAAQGSE